MADRVLVNGNIEDTAIHRLEQMKFRECPDGSGEVVVGVQICDQPPVEIVPSPDLPDGWTALSEFGSVTSVANATLTTIVSFTVPVSRKLILDRVEVSGDNKARYQVEIGGSVNAVKRTYWCDFNEDFEWDRFELTAGTLIRVQVEQNSRPDTGDYEARIIGIEGPA